MILNLFFIEFILLFLVSNPKFYKDKEYFFMVENRFTFPKKIAPHIPYIKNNKFIFFQ
jgi:hypothetical protein